MTTITDTSLAEVAAFPNDFQGAWIRLKYVDDNSATQERISRIHQFNHTSGILTFSPAIGNVNGTAGNVNGEYEIWVDVHPDEADNALNRILADTPFRSILPVSLVTDGDMEDSGVASWAAIGDALTTHAKATAVTLYGRQNLHIKEGASSTGVTSNNILVTPGEPLYLTVPLRVDNATITVTLYDATGSAAVDSASVTDTQLLEVRLQGSAPSGSNAATVRVAGAAQNDEAYVGPVSLLSGWRKRYPIDSSSVSFGADVLGVFEMTQGIGADDSDTYVQFPDARRHVNHTIEYDERAGVPTHVVLDRISGNPVFMETLQRHPSLSADSDTTTADKETVVNGVLFYLERSRGNEREAQRYLRTFNRLVELQGHFPVTHHRSNRQYVQM